MNFQYLKPHILFWLGIAALTGLIVLLQPYPAVVMWVAFAVAAYSAIANDSMQTLGTFIESTKQVVDWKVLALFIGGILVLTHTAGWFTDGGDIAFGRLEQIPHPSEFTIIQVLAPVVLVVLTRYRMPVSTTFLLLSVFSGSLVIKKMLVKTGQGYLIALVVALICWGILAAVRRFRNGGSNEESNDTPDEEATDSTIDTSQKLDQAGWRKFQFVCTGFLWCTWIMQDTANIAVFLPRRLNAFELIAAVGFLFLVVGFVMWRGGGEIQDIVNEKSDIRDPQAACGIDLTYGVILLVFKFWNNIPMSTTWVFLGLLAGREIALTLISRTEEPFLTTLKLVGKDILRAAAGMGISLALVFLSL